MKKYSSEQTVFCHLNLVTHLKKKLKSASKNVTLKVKLRRYKTTMTSLYFRYT
jgi:hypothetical protein